VERTIPYGLFVLVEPRGAPFGNVLIAPEYVLLQRAAHSTIRDVSYLVVWSAARIASVARELVELGPQGGDPSGVVDHTSRDLRSILHAIAPVATPLFLGGGDCGRTLRALVRRHLDAKLRAATHPATQPASGRRVS